VWPLRVKLSRFTAKIFIDNRPVRFRDRGNAIARSLGQDCPLAQSCQFRNAVPSHNVWRGRRTQRKTRVRVHSTVGLASSGRRAQTISIVSFFPNYSYSYVSYVASLEKVNLGYRTSKVRRLATFLVALVRDTENLVHVTCTIDLQY